VKKLKRYLNCDSLPAELFFKISKTGDHRYLLITDKYPEFVPDDLQETWEAIISEYEKLSGDYSISDARHDVKEDGKDANEINQLILCHLMMRAGDTMALEYLKDHGIFYDKITIANIIDLRNKIRLKKTNLELYQTLKLNRKEDQKQKEFHFLQALEQLSNLFQRNIPRDISTTQWIYLVKEARKRYKKRKNGKDRTV
jgi:hypothetical protein